jgi:uncharacterized protein
MTGTLINVIAVVIGTFLGIGMGSRLPERLRQTIIYALGLFSFSIGIQMFLKTGNSLVVLFSLLLGGILGEWLQIEDGLEQLGIWLQKHLMKGNSESERSGFVNAFLTASLLFCIGPVAILGSIQDGISGNYQLLTIKSIMDGFASIAIGASLGIGVAFSALPLLVYQGGISLLASQAQAWVTPSMMSEMTATGGVLLMGIAISNLLAIRKIRVGNLLPALFLAPLFASLVLMLGLKIP